jgi:Ca2+-transporting ATPase
MANINGYGQEGSRPSALEIFKISALDLKQLFIRDGDKNAEHQAL